MDIMERTDNYFCGLIEDRYGSLEELASGALKANRLRIDGTITDDTYEKWIDKYEQAAFTVYRYVANDVTEPFAAAEWWQINQSDWYGYVQQCRSES
jgi:hypothetical protein